MFLLLKNIERTEKKWGEVDLMDVDVASSRAFLYSICLLSISNFLRKSMKNSSGSSSGNVGIGKWTKWEWNCMMNKANTALPSIHTSYQHRWRRRRSDTVKLARTVRFSFWHSFRIANKILDEELYLHWMILFYSPMCTKHRSLSTSFISETKSQLDETEMKKKKKF